MLPITGWNYDRLHRLLQTIRCIFPGLLREPEQSPISVILQVSLPGFLPELTDKFSYFHPAFLYGLHRLYLPDGRQMEIILLPPTMESPEVFSGRRILSHLFWQQQISLLRSL